MHGAMNATECLVLQSASDVFNLILDGKVLKKVSTETKKFGNYVDSDGYSISLHMQKHLKVKFSA